MPAKTATLAQRRAYRSITTPAERKALRATSTKNAYAKNVAATGKSIRKLRKSQGFDPATGTKQMRGTPVAMSSGLSKLKRTVRDQSSAAKVARKPSSAKTGPTSKTKTVRRIAERRGISRAAANEIRKARKS